VPAYVLVVHGREVGRIDIPGHDLPGDAPRRTGGEEVDGHHSLAGGVSENVAAGENQGFPLPAVDHGAGAPAGAGLVLDAEPGGGVHELLFDAARGRRLGDQRRGGCAGGKRDARQGRRGGRRRRRRCGRLRVGLGQQFFQVGAGRGSVDAANLTAVNHEHIGGHARHGESPDEILLAIDVDMPHVPAGRFDLADERCHLPAGAAPGGHEVEQ